MSRTKTLTFHNGQYRASIGAEIKSDGQRRPKVFMLGADLRVALIREQVYRERWSFISKMLANRGEKKTVAVWDQRWLELAEARINKLLADIAVAQKIVNDFNGSLPPPENPNPIKPPPTPDTKQKVMLYAAIKEYLASLDERVKSKDVASSYRNRNRTSMDHLKKATKDYPLDETDYDRLQKIKLHLQGRPITSDGTPMAWGTIQTSMNQIRAFYRWPGNRGRWTRFDDWEKALSPKKTSDDDDTIILKAKARIKDLFTVDELVKLMRVANDNMATMVLTTLNTSQESSALSSLKKTHIVPRRIERVRGKKSSQGDSVYGEWALWPESEKAIAERMARNPKPADPAHAELAFLGRNGHPLVKETPTGRSDSIALAFADLCDDAGVRRRGYSQLKKTAIHLCEKVSNAAVADQFQLHSADSILRKHYSPVEFADVDAAIAKMAVLLRPVLDTYNARESTKQEAATIAA